MFSREIWKECILHRLEKRTPEHSELSGIVLLRYCCGLHRSINVSWRGRVTGVGLGRT